MSLAWVSVYDDVPLCSRTKPSILNPKLHRYPFSRHVLCIWASICELGRFTVVRGLPKPQTLNPLSAQTRISKSRVKSRNCTVVQKPGPQVCAWGVISRVIRFKTLSPKPPYPCPNPTLYLPTDKKGYTQSSYRPTHEPQLSTSK